MELIYADKDRNDIGILNGYEFDLAYGRDENNFQLTIDISLHCMQDDYVVYMIDVSDGNEEPTEYGGIIDAISPNTTAKTVTYLGRTWHGILTNKIIQPDSGQDYKVVYGYAGDIINGLLAEAGLADMFTASSGDYLVNITGYTFDRYIDLYSGITKMLADNGGKLLTRYNRGKVELTAAYVVDYSQNEEWDSAQIDFTIKKTANPVNHLICLGQGELKDRYVIHLFADDNGGVQPYALTGTPIMDEDYILDERNRVVDGEKEIVAVYDSPSSAITDNYVPLTVQPSDWWKNWSEYYTVDEDGKFVEVKGIDKEVLTLQTTQPSDWAENYNSYYTSNGKTVEGVQNDIYTPLNSMPADWGKNWSSYYTHFWDGVQWSWKSAESVTKTTYKKQTKKPTDWNTNFSAYFKLENKYKTTKKAGKTVKVKTGVGYASVSKVKKGKKQVVPTWAANKYYTAYSETIASDFNKGGVKYRLTQTTTAPTWQSNTYYTKTSTQVAPPWASSGYYRVHHDHFAELVRNGIEKLQDMAAESDSVNINLGLIGEYDVGDIVGASENITGVEVWQAVTKKIVVIKNNKKTVSYEIGANE